MKSERRHELHQNAFERWLWKAHGYIKAHSNLFVWGLLVLAVLVLVGVIWHRQSVKTEMEYQQEFTQWAADVAPPQDAPDAEIISHRRHIMENDKNPYRAATAGYNLGQYYYRKYMASQDKADRDQLAKQAAEAFTTVINKFTQERIIVAKAHFALGKLYESQGDLAKAEGEYNAVRAMTDLSNVPVVEMAGEAIRALQGFKQLPTFASTRPATEPAETQPATASAPATATAPSGQ